jgi:hypothetical protein
MRPGLGVVHYCAKQLIAERADSINEELNRSRKSIRWKARDHLGERVKWYELPEEINV